MMSVYRDSLVLDSNRMVDDFTLERCKFLSSMEAPTSPELDPDIDIDPECMEI
jgi:hypothetical protein